MFSVKTDFSDALRGLLRTQRDKALAGAGQAGWAPVHTAALDEALRPGLALVEVALGHEVSWEGVKYPTGKLPGRPLYGAVLAYAMLRAGYRDEALVAMAGERMKVGGALGLMWGLAVVAGGGVCPAFGELVRGQRASGEFLDASPYDSPDLHWYDELVVVHAVASYVGMTREEWMLEAVRRAARFHTAETQPDHATSQPWGLHVFAMEEECRPLADLLVHGALAQNAGRLDVMGRILLADAVLVM